MLKIKNNAGYLYLPDLTPSPPPFLALKSALAFQCSNIPNKQPEEKEKIYISIVEVGLSLSRINNANYPFF